VFQWSKRRPVRGSLQTFDRVQRWLRVEAESEPDMLLVLAPPACGSGGCHGAWLDSRSGELYVVGDRTPAEPAASAGRALASVRVSMLTYERAVAALCDATVASGIGYQIAADIRSGWAYLSGRPVACPPAAIGVAPHEEAVVVAQFAPALVTAFGRTGS
jgi:hypothetical protein